MSLSDAASLLLVLLLITALAVAGSFAFLTPQDRCAAGSVTTRAAWTVAVRGWNWIANVLLLLWVLVSWKRLTRNLGLTYADKHAVKRVRTTDKKGVTTEKEHPKIAYPHRFVRPDAYGVVLTVWTRAGIGRAEFEKAAEHMANTWRCRRVQIEQRKPGRITVRGLRRDPLNARLSLTIPDIPSERTNDNEHATTPLHLV